MLFEAADIELLGCASMYARTLIAFLSCSEECLLQCFLDNTTSYHKRCFKFSESLDMCWGQGVYVLLIWEIACPHSQSIHSKYWYFWYQLVMSLQGKTT